ncbi:mechanosensitive ion channel family protein [Haloplanus rallus]|uniref:Mechanosensitive ion channel family protein n=1 Tax=Haloplanus rallus TaxID=1816183 RepID=A0A6B9FDG7_9EURY|nr:mechanosensitive ion channel family protein [Haloplanus rallus]QGX94510.1 mechanosensitive ion channel family protein [Haloplanus rallus]
MTGAAVPLQNGALAEFLGRNGVPYADAIGSAVIFVVVLVAVYVIGRAVVLPLVDRLMENRGLERHARRPLRKLTLLVVVFAGIAVAFGMAGYGDFLQSLATVAAAATLAIGFAMQDVIANFVAGVFIFTDKPFKIGDWIEWDGNSGIVEDISFRVSRVRTFDNELLTVPNSHLTDGVIKNPVAKGQLRLQVPFGIGYDDDIERANEIILEEAHAHPDILEDPAPSVRLTELGDSSVVLKSRVWIDDPSRSDFVKTRGEYVTGVKERFDEEDINIPYPNRTLGGSLELAGVDETVVSD